ncbi:MAG: hypothetical protein L3J82_05920, partial [Planctomycetes bacterium]|nr:hypothetical protein [Planctomycetota bacterium]
VIIAVTTLSMPLLERSFSGQKLDKGADLVRAHMGRARVQAIKTGKVFAFYYQVDGAGFRVAPFSKAVVASMKRQTIDEELRTSNFDFGQDLLPRDVTFAVSKTRMDARAELVISETPVNAGSMEPILFYPDGTSQDAKVFLRSVDDDIVQVTLRGLTGTSTVQRVDEDMRVIK